MGNLIMATRRLCNSHGLSFLVMVNLRDTCRNLQLILQYVNYREYAFQGNSISL